MVPIVFQCITHFPPKARVQSTVFSLRLKIKPLETAGKRQLLDVAYEGSPDTLSSVFRQDDDASQPRRAVREDVLHLVWLEYRRPSRRTVEQGKHMNGKCAGIEF